MHKAVILARGLGTRMRRADAEAQLDAHESAAADTGVKALIPIDRPFLDYVLSALVKAGYQQVCLVVGPEHGAIREYYGQQARPQKLEVHFAVQQEPRGTADAVASVEAFAAGDHFLVLNSDNYYPLEALRGLREISGNGVAMFEDQAMLAGSNIPADRLRQFAVGKIDDQGNMERILEKPDDATLASLPRPLWLSMNCWRFGPSIFEGCRQIKPSPRGELELPDAVQYVINVLQEPFHVVEVRAPVLDLSSRRDIATVRERLIGTEVSF